MNEPRGRDEDRAFTEHRLSDQAQRRRPFLESDLVSRVDATHAARRRRNATGLGTLLLAVVSGAFLLADRSGVRVADPPVPRLAEVRTEASGDDEVVAIVDSTSTTTPRVGIPIIVIDGVVDHDIVRPKVQIISRDRLLTVLVDSGMRATIRCGDAAPACDLTLLDAEQG